MTEALLVMQGAPRYSTSTVHAAGLRAPHYKDAGLWNAHLIAPPTSHLIKRTLAPVDPGLLALYEIKIGRI